MKLDRERLAEVLAADYSYYDGPTPTCTVDERLNPSASDFIGSQLTPRMTVLDVGCGDGTTLLRHRERFRRGVGIDSDPAHLDLATRGKIAAGAQNVDFLLLDIGDLPDQPWRDHFDFVFSERGPIGYGVRGVQAALRVLRPGGLLFSEVIGDLHHQEVREVFGGAPRFNQHIRTLEQIKVATERSGVEIRVAADVVSKRYYPDVYEWLKFQCGIWAWSGQPLPSPDDPRLQLFAQRNTGPDGIEVTHHVAWVGGTKLTDPPPYDEYAHFA